MMESPLTQLTFDFLNVLLLVVLPLDVCPVCLI